MKTTCTVNGEPCVVEGSDRAVNQFFDDLAASGESYERGRDKLGGEQIHVNGTEHVRVTRYTTNNDDDADETGIHPLSTKPKMENDFNTTGSGSFTPEYDAGAAFNFAGVGFPSIDESLVDNSHGPGEGLDMPSTRPPLEDARPKQATANAAARFDDDPGDDDGLDMPSTRPPLTA